MLQVKVEVINKTKTIPVNLADFPSSHHRLENQLAEIDKIFDSKHRVSQTEYYSEDSESQKQDNEIDDIKVNIEEVEALLNNTKILVAEDSPVCMDVI